jgi:hypothetical protein
MEFQIRQFGGSEGSYAGDAAIVICKKSDKPRDVAIFVIDLGHTTEPRGEVSQMAAIRECLMNLPPHNDLYFIHTHEHADHSGGADPNSKGLPTLLSKLRAKYVYGDAAPAKLGKGLQDTYERVLGAGKGALIKVPAGNYWSWEHGAGDQRVAVHAIAPTASKDDVDENERSLGVAIALFKKKGAGEVCVASYLSLGDMVPKTAEPVLLDFVVNGPGKAMLPFTAIKLAHHASNANLMPRLWGLALSNKTTVVSSGFTKSDPKFLARMMADGPSSQLAFLVRDKALFEEFSGNVVAALLRANLQVQFAIDFVLHADENGFHTQLEGQYYDSKAKKLSPREFRENVKQFSRPVQSAIRTGIRDKIRDDNFDYHGLWVELSRVHGEGVLTAEAAKRVADEFDD